MTANSNNIPALAERLATLADAYKDDVASIIEDAREAEVEPSALRRLASWKRMDPTKRAEREALDEQYRFLAGELPEPAALPTEGELAEAAALYAEGKSVRDVSIALKISTGKAHQLKVKASAFTVHRKMNVNTSPTSKSDRANSKFAPISPSPNAWAFITAARDAADAARAAEVARIAAEKEAERERRRAEREALAARNREIDADKLELPAHLRRVA